MWSLTVFLWKLASHERQRRIRRTAAPFAVVVSGEMFVLHQGEIVSGRRFRADQASPYKFVDEAGTKVVDKSGSLYLLAIPSYVQLQFSANPL